MNIIVTSFVNCDILTLWIWTNTDLTLIAEFGFTFAGSAAKRMREITAKILQKVMQELLQWFSCSVLPMILYSFFSMYRYC